MSATKSTAPTAYDTNSGSPGSFTEVATIQGELDVVCAITKREQRGLVRYSFSFYKEYDVDGTRKRSHWFDRRHIPALRKVLDEAEIWLDQTDRRARAAGG